MELSENQKLFLEKQFRRSFREFLLNLAQIVEDDKADILIEYRQKLKHDNIIEVMGKYRVNSQPYVDNILKKDISIFDNDLIFIYDFNLSNYYKENTSESIWKYLKLLNSCVNYKKPEKELPSTENLFRNKIKEQTQDKDGIPNEFGKTLNDLTGSLMDNINESDVEKMMKGDMSVMMKMMSDITSQVQTKVENNEININEFKNSSENLLKELGINLPDQANSNPMQTISNLMGMVNGMGNGMGNGMVNGMGSGMGSEMIKGMVNGIGGDLFGEQDIPEYNANGSNIDQKYIDMAKKAKKAKKTKNVEKAKEFKK